MGLGKPMLSTDLPLFCPHIQKNSHFLNLKTAVL
jgi:hypothetical protein